MQMWSSSLKYCLPENREAGNGGKGKCEILKETECEVQ